MEKCLFTFSKTIRFLLAFLVFCVALTRSWADSVTGFTLVNAATNQDIGPLISGSVINLNNTGTQLNIRANTSPSIVGSVVFALDGNSKFRVESSAPYTLAGDKSGDYNSWTPAVGTHTLSVTPYTLSGSSGTAGTPLSITFSVTSTTVSEPIPPPTTDPGTGAVTLQGELKKWHKITLSISGPAASETSSNNPFLNYRLNVTFTNGAKSYTVPGYFAADGNAAETGATSGNTWRVHFSPDEIGTWTYAISMRSGTNVAVSDDPNAGSAVSLVNGKTGSFSIANSDKTGRDLRGKGRLKYIGGHHLQFAETKEYFLKGGVDSPENLLAYNDFDNTPDNGGRRKSYSPHLQDWKTGDPTWKGGKGKGIIGVVNYLSSQGLNAFSFLTMNINGDDKNVYPYVSSSNYTQFDCSKLDQWEKVFEHGDKMGMYLHFKTQETENDQLLDGGAVGTQRKLYYRELIARFSHHLALNWNLGEENTQTDQQRKDMAKYFHDHDPYKNHIVLHTYPGQQNTVYTPLLGSASNLTGVSIQTDWSNVYTESKKWIINSANAGKKWVVANDEQGSASVGVACDATYSGNRGSVADNQDGIRKEVLWGNLMAGGAGVEYYFGYSTGETDLTAQDFRSRAKMYRFTQNALTFFRSYVPFTELQSMSNVSSGWCLGKEGKVYVVYLKSGGTSNITINTNGTYSVKWYDPRNGGSLQNGSVTSISGTGTKSLGNPPNNGTQDWAVLVTNTGTSMTPTPTASSYRINAGGSQVSTSLGSFAADSYFSGGKVYTNNTAITGTSDDVIYQTERYGNFVYAVPVPSAQYRVVLHFAELYFTASGKRVFDVTIEGAKVLSNYDIYAKAGANTAKTETFTVNVSDGTLNIAFASLVNNAKVAAIEVIPTSSARTASPETMPTITAYPNPTASDITVSGLDTQCQELQISLTNGVSTYYPSYQVATSGSIQVNTSNCKAGHYILRIRQCGKDYMHKIVIQR